VRSLSDMDNAARDLRENAKLWSANGMDNLLRNVPETWTGGIKLMTEAGMLSAGVKAETLYTNVLWDKARGK
jgi:hypothetical protein